jgi:hypothetical protein
MPLSLTLIQETGYTRSPTRTWIVGDRRVAARSVPWRHEPLRPSGTAHLVLPEHATPGVGREGRIPVSRPGKAMLTSGFADEFGSLRTNGSPFRHPSRTGAQSKTVGEGPCSIRYNCTQLLAIVGAGRHSRQVSVDQEVTRAMNTSRRRYHSAIRQEHAEQTRVRIRDAARRLFSKHGFAGTTVRAIAQEAGVAEPTVYAVYGSKSTIFTALMEALEAEAGIEELHAQLVVGLRTRPGSWASRDRASPVSQFSQPSREAFVA